MLNVIATRSALTSVSGKIGDGYITADTFQTFLFTEDGGSPNGETVLLAGNGGNARWKSQPVLSITGSAPAYPARAWVNFDGTTAANVNATYSRTGTTVTVTLNDHGYLAGHVVYADFTSGAATDGIFTITGATQNTFTFTHGSSGATSGNVILLRRLIRASGNIHSISYLNAAGVYYTNFLVAMPDASYSLSLNTGPVRHLVLPFRTSGASATLVPPQPTGFRAVNTQAGAATGENSEYLLFEVFR